MKKHSMAIACLALCAAGLPAGTTPAHDYGDHDRGFDRGLRGEVLALGDSIAFGYITRAEPQYVNARNFVGYPQYLAGG